MNTTTEKDISYSDNSHILGRPIRILQGEDGFMDIPVMDKSGTHSLAGLIDWIKKVAFLEHAGIEMHLKYAEEI